MADDMRRDGGDDGTSDDPTKLRKTARAFPAMLRREMRARSQTTPFLIWISFLLAFGGSRLWVHLFKSTGRGDTSGISFEIGRNVIIGGYHIHHIATGIALLALAGWLTLHYRGRQIARTSAVMYGVGLGFIVDEMGFVIGGITPYRGDDEVVYTAILLASLLMSAVFAPRFWKAFREDLRSMGRIVAHVPALRRPQKERTGRQVDQELEAMLGPPPALQDPDAADHAAPEMLDEAAGRHPASSRSYLPAVPRTGVTASISAAARRSALVPEHLGAFAATKPTAFQDPAIAPADYRSTQSSRTHVFDSLTAKVMEILVIIIFVGLLLGIAKLILSMTDVLFGLSVARLMQPILVGVLTLLIGVQLLRAMVEYLRHARLMLPFLVDAAVLLGLREIADELFKTNPDPVLVAVIGGLLVALGGLRVILVRSMHELQATKLPRTDPAEPPIER